MSWITNVCNYCNETFLSELYPQHRCYECRCKPEITEYTKKEIHEILTESKETIRDLQLKLTKEKKKRKELEERLYELENSWRVYRQNSGDFNQ